MYLQLLVHSAQVTQCYRYVKQCDIMSDETQTLCDCIIIEAGELTFMVHCYVFRNINFLPHLVGV